MRSGAREQGHEADDAIGAVARSTLAGVPAAGSFAWASAVGNQAVQRLARRAARARLLARITPDEILAQYQVKEDKTAIWSAKAFGAIPLPFETEKATLTVTEGKLLDKLTSDRGFDGLRIFRNIRDDANRVSTTWIPDPATIPSYVPGDRLLGWKDNDGHRDAYRHCYWNARLAKEFGQSWTQQFCTAHEATPGNQAAREAMDLYNNEVGRKIVKENPDATVVDLETLVKRAVDSGQVVVIDRAGRLQWSDQVGTWNHGVAGLDLKNPGVIDVPAGDVSAQQANSG